MRARASDPLAPGLLAICIGGPSTRRSRQRLWGPGRTTYRSLPMQGRFSNRLQFVGPRPLRFNAQFSPVETWQQAGDTSALELMLIEVESHGLAELDTLLSFHGTLYSRAHNTTTAAAAADTCVDDDGVGVIYMIFVVQIDKRESIYPTIQTEQAKGRACF